MCHQDETGYARLRVKPSQKLKFISLRAREGRRASDPSIPFEPPFRLLQRLRAGGARFAPDYARTHRSALFRCASSAFCVSVRGVSLSRSEVNCSQSGVIIGHFIVAIFGGTRHLQPPSDCVRARLQFFDLFRNGGDVAVRSGHQSPQLKLDVAIVRWPDLG